MLEFRPKNWDERCLMKRITSLVVIAVLSAFSAAVSAVPAMAQAAQLPGDISLDEAGARNYQNELAHAASRDVAKPTPRLADGRVDFGGTGVWAAIWVLDWADKRWVDKSIDVPFTPWGLAKFKERRANLSKDDPEAYCLPPGVPRYAGTPYPFQFIQLPDRVVILYEGGGHTFRTIFMDGRKHTPADQLNPTWMGESIGYWEGNDTLVVDTIGFNGKTWLDYVGHPASEKLHVIEKYRRPDFNTLSFEATIDDSVAYIRRWTTGYRIYFRPGWELLEYVCVENNKDLIHLNTSEPK
jgi:hypothetical protein